MPAVGVSASYASSTSSDCRRRRSRRSGGRGWRSTTIRRRGTLSGALKQAEIGRWRMATVGHFAAVRDNADKAEKSIRRLRDMMHTLGRPLMVGAGACTFSYVWPSPVGKRSLPHRKSAGSKPRPSSPVCRRRSARGCRADRSSLPVTQSPVVGRVRDLSSMSCLISKSRRVNSVKAITIASRSVVASSISLRASSSLPIQLACSI